MKSIAGHLRKDPAARKLKNKEVALCSNLSFADRTNFIQGIHRKFHNGILLILCESID